MAKACIAIWTLFFLLSTLSAVSALLCLSCPKVTKVLDCDTLEKCRPDQRCSSYRQTDGNGSHWFSLGCADNSACDKVHPALLGKRNTIHEDFIKLPVGQESDTTDPHKRLDDVATCGQCCNDTDGCNADLCGGTSVLVNRRCVVCHDALQTSHCNKFTACGIDEFCFVQRRRDSVTLEYRYQMKCNGYQQCKAVEKTSPEHCIACCNSTDFCNYDACNNWNATHGQPGAPATTTTDPPSTQSPVITTTNPPNTQSPVITTTNPPNTQSPVITTTNPPNTQSPVITTTNPPNTQSPVITTTNPPSTQSPVITTTNPPNTQSPVITTTNPPNTQSPVITTTNPPNTQSPVITTTNPPNTQSPVITTTNPPNTQSPVITTTNPPNTQSPVITTTNPSNTQSPVMTTNLITTNPPSTQTPVIMTNSPSTQSPEATATTKIGTQSPVSKMTKPSNTQSPASATTYLWTAQTLLPVTTFPSGTTQLSVASTSTATTPTSQLVIDGPHSSAYKSKQELKCVSVPPAQAYIWKFNGTLVLPNGVRQEAEVIIGPSLAAYDKLIIARLNETAVGTYTCIAIINGRLTERNHFIGITKEAPTVTVVKPVITSNFALLCNATGYPPPQIGWGFLKAGGNPTPNLPPDVAISVKENVAILVVPFYRPEAHDGSWYCAATNNLGNDIGSVNVP